MPKNVYIHIPFCKSKCKYCSFVSFPKLEQKENYLDALKKEIHQNYKNEILQLLYRDERISDVVIDDELNIDMVFYTDYCPFYYDDKPSIKYNEFLDSPTYQAIMLVNFTDYMQNRVVQESFISTRNLIKDFTETVQVNNENKEVLSNFLKKSIIQTGFVDKYIDNISVYVTHKNYKELEEGLSNIVKQKDKEAKRLFMKAIKETEEEFE